jgi:hypothetical protein
MACGALPGHRHQLGLKCLLLITRSNSVFGLLLPQYPEEPLNQEVYKGKSEIYLCKKPTFVGFLSFGKRFMPI